MSLRLQAALRSGDKVLMTDQLGVGWHDTGVLFEVPDITLYRGETVGLIGPNGAGKSTFLKTITEQIAPLSGSVRLGAGVQIGYFAQAHEGLNPNNSLIDEVSTVKPMVVSAARDLLARYLFTGDDVFRQVSTLSGGERGRLALAKLALTGANLLLLDEPTNHLDIDSQEVLQTVIADFTGTVILVTHDRYLVDALASQIWAVRRGEMTVYEGSYKEYKAWRDTQAAKAAEAAQEAKRPAAKTAMQAAAKKHGLNPFQLQKRIEAAEARVTQLEEAINDLHNQIGAASASGDVAAVASLGEAYTQAETDLHAAMAEWESLVE